MNFLKMKKRGISPLIATVLLIGFTVALAAMVMTWGSGFIKKTTEQTEKGAASALKCTSELAFQISGVSCNPDKSIASIKVDSRGSLEIKSLKFRLISDAQTTVDDKTEALEAFGAKTYSGFKPNPNVNKVEAIATVSGGAGNEDIICSQAVEEFTVNCPTA